MVLRTLLHALYSPNVWQNRFDDNLGLIIISIGVIIVAVHFIVRKINPPIKEEH